MIFNKIAVAVKTDLKYDGRVLNHLEIISELFENSKIYLLYLADGPTLPQLPKNVIINEVKLLTRNLPKSWPFQIIKNIEYALKTMIHLFAIKPQLIHIHDELALLGPYIYGKINSKVKIIYDDHELKHMEENISLREKIEKNLEEKIFLLSDAIIVANEHRKDFLLRKIPRLKKDKMYVVENWVSENKEKSFDFSPLKISKKILLHQGVLNQNRCDHLLASLSLSLPIDWQIGILGVSKSAFNSFISKYDLKIENFIFFGKVNYSQINSIWMKIDGGVIFYETKKINNRLCAPNRLFLSTNLGKPIIVNSNPVLKEFVEKNKFGCVYDNNEEEFDFFKNYNLYEANAKNIIGRYFFSNQKPIYKDIVRNL